MTDRVGRRRRPRGERLSNRAHSDVMQSQSISSFDYSQELGSGGGASGGASVGGGDE
eukprot:CAMPEP_0119498504 /NCGR_PEP_ID=MMETSP1344-20130328/21231_1 /TAXON_ID=236787 /ORGANISM="Florenciella parvula, Strain CCMP2471" /LENGTH=56 /DNA_ID=CAMNT_0007534385 /DNA_START=115 /DNA_END=282 /DNA_ORIENTATION=-